jgi:hypothetical protein
LRRLKMRRLWIVLAGVFVMAGTASAQGFSERVEAGLEEMQALKQAKVAELVKLEGDQMAGFRVLYEEFQEALREKNERYIEIVWQYLDTSKEMTDTRARTMVREYLELEESKARLRNSYMEQFGKILPPVQLIHLFQLENKAEAVFKYDLATHIPMLE